VTIRCLPSLSVTSFWLAGSFMQPLANVQNFSLATKHHPAHYVARPNA
jgi:hypothetical protein